MESKDSYTRVNASSKVSVLPTATPSPPITNQAFVIVECAGQTANLASYTGNCMARLEWEMDITAIERDLGSPFVMIRKTKRESRFPCSSASMHLVESSGVTLVELHQPTDR